MFGSSSLVKGRTNTESRKCNLRNGYSLVITIEGSPFVPLNKMLLFPCSIGFKSRNGIELISSRVGFQPSGGDGGGDVRMNLSFFGAVRGFFLIPFIALLTNRPCICCSIYADTGTP